MISYTSDTQQDTVKVGKFLINESIRLKTYSLPEIRQLPPRDTVKHARSVPAPSVPLVTDTTSVCARNSIADVTFYDSANFITTLKPANVNRFLYLISEKNRVKQAEEKAFLLRQLKEGKEIPFQPLHSDWLILIILFAAFLFSFIRAESKSFFPGVSRFFLFRGINDPSSRDLGGLFHWQSTLSNLVSFLVLGLYCYCSAAVFDSVPSGISGMVFWFISIGIIISAVTLRHIVCVITGSVSGQREAFREYLLSVYQSYRFSALFLFIFVVMMAYTTLFSAKVYFTLGVITFAVMYLFRIIRLLIIFINRSISVLYLILYLCALEILPVVISVKYITGLV